MLLKKTVSDDGEIEVTINGKALDFELSRELTGTTGECGLGVFTNDETSEGFEFGDFKATILFAGTYDYSWQMEDLAPAIFDRIKKVREWVEDCRNSGGEVFHD